MINNKQVLATVAFMAISTAAFAGDFKRPSFSDIDADGNGEISLQELQAQRDAKFLAIDTDGNGEISKEELAAKMSERMKDHDDSDDDQARKDRMFAVRDKDSSGGLSKDEFFGKDDHAEMMIAKLDADGNGVISEEEFNAKKGKRDGHGKKGHDK